GRRGSRTLPSRLLRVLAHFRWFRDTSAQPLFLPFRPVSGTPTHLYAPLPFEPWSRFQNKRAYSSPPLFSPIPLGPSASRPRAFLPGARGNYCRNPERQSSTLQYSSESSRRWSQRNALRVT